MKKYYSILIHSVFASMAALLLPSCESPGGAVAGGPGNASGLRYRPQSSAEAHTAGKPMSRPGLATKAGETGWSQVEDGFFHRKATGQPDAVGSFHYNDEAGARAMMGALGGAHEHGGLFKVAGGRLRAGLSCGGGECAYLETGDHRVVMGKAGSSYGIRLKNCTRKRLEVVVSVDGLDVLDAQTASVKKDGYILEPGQEYTISGFRVNNRSVKQFLFGSVGESEAAKKGQARNVGVIGLAVYEEDEAAAKAARLKEALVRANAEAFH